MAQDFTKNLDKDLSVQILKNVSNGVALFDSVTFNLIWCNLTFKKQTRFGSAGREAEQVNLDNFFEEKDRKLIHELFNIALTLGQAYDFQRQVKRGTIQSFPAEIKMHKIQIKDDNILICLEILDLSITKMYYELQNTHAQVSEKMADLMSAQAELHHSVRMNTISEIGSDIAHQLINPITMCRGILESQILPALTTKQCLEDMNQALKYMKDIQDLAVWFRKFSDAKRSETQVSKITDLVNDTCMLNVNRFTTQGITYKIKKEKNYNPSILVNSVNFIMWLNACFAELVNALSDDNKLIHISLTGNNETVDILIECKIKLDYKDKITISTLEKFATKMPGAKNFTSVIENANISFSLTMSCFKDESIKDYVIDTVKNPQNAVFSSTEKPLVFIVDDEQDIRRLIKRAMKQSGWDAVEAEDGAEALDFYQQAKNKPISDRIVAIVSDVRMPRMTGPHFLVALRAENIQTPFIFFSSNLVDKGENGFKYDNVFYLTKEAGLEELKKLVSNCMPTKPALDMEKGNE